MSKLSVVFAVLLFCGCSHAAKREKKTSTSNQIPAKSAVTDTAEKPIPRYSDQQLETFLDSVGQLPTQPLEDKVAFGADSVFRSPASMDTLISPADFAILKRAARSGVVNVKTARRIFKNDDISYDCNTKSVFLTYKVGLIPVVYTPFTKNKRAFNEFSLCIGDPGHCENAYLYFFIGRRVIAVHNGYDRNGPDLAWYKDSDGKTVVYYGKEFVNGTGVWWFNYFFYKYDGGKLIPVLNELQNANLLQPTPSGGNRCLWLESFIKKTNPLTIKMVYHQQFIKQSDTVGYDYSPMFVNDSTVVQYKWNELTKTFEGQYAQSKISKAQILSYYLFGDDRLFINSHYGLLKRLLKDKIQRQWLLNYLSEIKYYSQKK